MTEQISVQRYNRLIHKLAWEYCQKWDMEESDMYTEGLYIFITTLNKFEKGKAKFITYLHLRLENYMDKYGQKESTQVYRFFSFHHVIWNEPNMYDEEDVYFKEMPDEVTSLFIKGLEFYESASTDLSEDAKQVLGMILRSLENTTSHQKPSLHGTTKQFQLSFEWVPSRTKKAWEEVKNWWVGFNLVPC